MTLDTYFAVTTVVVAVIFAFIIIPYVIRKNRDVADLKIKLVENEHLIFQMKKQGIKNRELKKKFNEELERKQRTLDHKNIELEKLKKNDTEQRARGYEVNAVMIDATRTINNLTFAIESIYEQQGLEQVNKKNLKDFLKLFLKRDWEAARHIGKEVVDVSIVHVEKLLDWMEVDKHFDKICDLILANIQYNFTELLERGRDKGQIGFMGVFGEEGHEESAAYFHKCLLEDGFPEDLIDTSFLLFFNRIIIHPIGLVRALCLDHMAGQWLEKDRIVVIAYDNTVNHKSLYIYPHHYIKTNMNKTLNNIFR